MIIKLYRLLFPALVTILFIAISNVNFRNEFFISYVPIISTMAIFYWAAFWPELMPKVIVFFIGIIQDAIQGMPFGFSSFSLLILWFAIFSQRRFISGESFMGIWLIYMVSVGFYMILNLLTISLYYKHMIFSYDLVTVWVMNCILYPIFHYIFYKIHSSLIKNLQIKD